MKLAVLTEGWAEGSTAENIEQLRTLCKMICSQEDQTGTSKSPREIPCKTGISLVTN